MTELELMQREVSRERAARKEAEQLLEQKSLELYHRNRDLETEVGERKRIEASLREYSVALSRSNAELEQFAYIASHDLQAPLRSITGFIQLLDRRLKSQLGEAMDADCKEFMHFIEEGAVKMREVIRDLLEFSRAGRAGNDLVRVSLSTPLNRALADLSGVLRNTGAVVQHGALPQVMGEDTQLAQLLRNLIDNAIKYVPAGRTPCIDITAAIEGAMVQVAVADNGIGIAQEHRERVFQIFQRLHSADVYPGTGVGLAICKKVVDRHGGRIWVECPADGGSVFHFTLHAAL